MYRFIIGVFVAVTVSASVWRVLEASESPAPGRAPAFAFFEYLQDERSALVAFNPTEYDPRPAHRRVPTTESIVADLRALQTAFDGLILYAFDKDVTPHLLAEMVKLGYRAVLLGIWNPSSTEELEGTARLVRQYQHQLALAVCIGNEGIHFDRYRWEEVIAGQESLRKLLGVLSIPICTSEPLVQYEQPHLREFGDFLAPNIHPVFDRPDLGPAEAAAWARARALALAETAARPTLLKESGMTNGPAQRFSPETQRAFWAAYVKEGLFVQVSPDVFVSYGAAFEFFNMEWKAEESGMAIEKHWGLFDAQRKPYPAFFVWEALRQNARLSEEMTCEESKKE